MGKKDLFRDVSIKLLFPIFWKSGLSANKITVLNFLTFGLGSVALFAFGYEYLGLLTAGLAAMVDYVDGTVARAGRENPKGAYLDTSLDWLWLMMLIGAISYHHNVLLWGYIALIAITFGNWVEYNGKVKFQYPFPLGISHLLVISILFHHANYGIIIIAITQVLKTGGMYLWSIFKD